MFLIQNLAARRLFDAANGTKALLELVNAALGINELFLSGEEGVRVSSHANGDNVILNAIDDFLLIGSDGGTSEVAVATGHVLERDRVVIGVNVVFHGMSNTRLEATFPTLRGGSLSKKPLVSMRFQPRNREKRDLRIRNAMNLTNYERMDPHLLVGLVNTELRNNAESLEDLCKTHSLNRSVLEERLKAGDYVYQKELKQFR